MPIIAPIIGSNGSWCVAPAQYGAGTSDNSSPGNYSNHFLFAFQRITFGKLKVF